MNTKILTRNQLANWRNEQRARNRKIVSTNGCFDILHVGHVQLLQQARALGDCLIVFINADESVRRLKGESRPVNEQIARAEVLAALECVDAVCVFEEDTPQRVLEVLQPDIHVKGGDYKIDDLPETKTVRDGGGEVVIVPLRKGFSTTNTLQKIQAETAAPCQVKNWIVIPARYGSTRFPGKPLAMLGDKPVIAHVVERALQTRATRPILVATDDDRIASAVEERFAPQDARVVLTGVECATGTDRIAEVVTRLLAENANETKDETDTAYSNVEYANVQKSRAIIVNIQGDEPFVNPTHIDQLFDVMEHDINLKMATLATPIDNINQIDDSNVVKVVCAQNGDALYFSRCSVPFVRDAIVRDAIDATTSSTRSKLRHLGVYAYEANWLLEMAALPPTPLEESEKLEQLRALEHGVAIRVLVVDDVVSIAIDTPNDLTMAQNYLEAVLEARNLPSATAHSGHNRG